VLPRMLALKLLSECTGDEIWSREHCTNTGVPDSWINELIDCYESGYITDSQTIYVGNQNVNQYEGVRDVDLAYRIGKNLGIDVDRLQETSLGRSQLVRAIREEVEEGEANTP